MLQHVASSVLAKRHNHTLPNAEPEAVLRAELETDAKPARHATRPQLHRDHVPASAK